ncbi:gamma-glutamylcyclotransferase [Thalassotalea sp. M1531]|uniref:Gamma-glutamylcyclotransferase n=1 Tax=Thalassotalea algicola TaxID=2716224 RepID=A0A7Y0Q7A6_9GAMM|nr:gamma-glutamylcyclotransferase family protein [Thalassotalea algicola]NMP31986.1 gamma-glutamylcyclotransferase [Thalassotalea algicola]
MKYFAYGSNMSFNRLSQRTPSVKRLGRYALTDHSLKFHKASHDGSGKCDAHYTRKSSDEIIGALYEINADEKPILDKIEGLGLGYELKWVKVTNEENETIDAFIYYATDINPELKPYSWYLNHVIVGAKEIDVPIDYLKTIEQTPFIEDSNASRAQQEFDVHR